MLLRGQFDASAARAGRIADQPTRRRDRYQCRAPRITAAHHIGVLLDADDEVRQARLPPGHARPPHRQVVSALSYDGYGRRVAALPVEGATRERNQPRVDGRAPPEPTDGPARTAAARGDRNHLTAGLDQSAAARTLQVDDQRGNAGGAVPPARSIRAHVLWLRGLAGGAEMFPRQPVAELLRVGCRHAVMVARRSCHRPEARRNAGGEARPRGPRPQQPPRLLR